MSDYLTFIQLKAQGADSVKYLLVQNEIEPRKWMFGIVFNNTNILHQFIFKLKKTKFIVKPLFPHKFILTNSLSHEESLILKIPFEREQFYHYTLDCR